VGGLAALIFIIALALRLAPLNRYVTPDEPAWIYRSIRFSQALAARDLAAIPDTGHPGVTTMWLGGLGLQLQRWLSPEQAANHLDWLDGLAGLSPESPAAFRHLAFFLPVSRVLVALATSMGLLGVFFLVNRLWGLAAAALAALLLALDPFLAGHSALLHLDGLLATLMTLSALAMLLAVHSFRHAPSLGRESTGSISSEPKRTKGLTPHSWTVVSGVLGGLAVLTKTPGAFLALFVAALLITTWLTRRASWRQALVALALWALAAGLIVVIVYPAFWADPVGTLRRLFEVGERHVEGALRPIFYRGQFTYEPDVTFYPVVWLFRASPLVLVGVIVALAVYLRRPGARRFDIVALLALALGFGLFVTLVGKKHDRYLLPIFPLLTIIAALGWEEVGRFGVRKIGAKARITESPNHRISYFWFVPAVLILIQLFLILPYLTAPLGYFSPLLGGAQTALDWLEVGWGEGLGSAARWLNQRPNAEGLIVATPSIPSFASFFVGHTVPLDRQTAYQADYIVYPPRQGLEQVPFEPESRDPAFSEIVGGVSFADVIHNPIVGEQVTYLKQHSRQGDLIILDAASALARQYDGPADLVVLADAKDAAEVAAHLEGLVPDHDSLWHVALPAASPITARYVQQQLACYGQTVSSEIVGGVAISEITQNQAQSCDVSSIPPASSRFSDALGLTDALLPGEPIAWPGQLSILVRWSGLAALPADYRTIFHLRDEAGRSWAGGGQEILDVDYRRPTAWSPGEWSDQRFRLALPPGIPPGRYTVEMGVFDPLSGVALSAWDAAGDFAGLSLDLGPATVVPPEHPPSPWDVVMAERLDPPLSVGSLSLLGYGAPPGQIASGDRVSFDLFWQATIVPEADYAVRWQLISTAGNVALEETAPLSPYPTSRWRAHELEQVRYDLPISPDLTPDDYVLAVNVLDGGGAPLWSEDVVLAEVEILARDRLFSLPGDIAYPLDVTLGDAVHLRGFDLDILSARPGDQLPLTLYWQADGPTDLSYTVFVHLVGPDGALHGQSDHLPDGGGAPTHTWAPDQVIVDEILLPVLADAPPGSYHIAVGLYDANSGLRPPVYDATGAELPDGQILLPIQITVQ
jgi:4-amino-4-deoxy-L-arabinose transferase-like glycosyltransferase